MPIHIYNKIDYKEIDFLCDDVWDLPNQLDSLENWIRMKGKNLPKGNYVADIGFNIRKDACGGGGVVDSESLKLMGEIGISVYFSEYPSQ